MSRVKIRPIEKWVCLQGIYDELADDTLALEAYKESLIDEGLEKVREMGREPTGETSVELIPNLFLGVGRGDPYDYRLRAVIKFYGDEEEVDEEELHQP